MDTGYLYSKDKKRIFINTCLGCVGQCLYCYLPKMGYGNKENLEVKKAEELIEEIQAEGFTNETLITLGCFSECWDDKNKPETLKLLKYFLSRGNQIQMSTKKEVKLEEIEDLSELLQYNGQLVIFVSSATISKHDSLEKGTETLERRFNTFDISKNLNIPTVLYMKPILKGITIKDIDKYVEIIRRYGIKDVVVGSIFSERERPETVHFSNERKLFYDSNEDELEIKQKLLQQKNVRVFSRSSQVMDFYRKKELERY